MKLIFLVLGLLLLPVGPAIAEHVQYTLGKAVETALERNFTIDAAESDLMAAQSGAKAARAAFGPVLSTSYDFTRRQHERTSSGQNQDKDLYTWRVALTQNVFSGLETLSQYQRAALSRASSEAGVFLARLDLVNLVQEHFFLYMQAKQEVISARASLERLRSQLASSQAFYRVGVSPRIDVLQAEVDVSTAESTLLIAENVLETQRVRLNTLLVLPAEADVEYIGDFVFTPFTLTLDECLYRAFGQRPDLLIAERAVEIAGKDKTIAQSGFFPYINAQAAWSAVGDDPSVSGSSVREVRYSEWTFGLSAEWTLFEWGRNYHEVQQAGHIQGKVRAEADNLRQEIIFEVKERLLALSDAAKRIRVAEKAVEQAAEAYRMSDARYRSQVGTMTDVLDAQAKLSYAEASLAGAKADYSIALSRIYAAMGVVNPDLRDLR